MKVFFVFLTVVFSQFVFATPDHPKHAPVAMPKEFEMLKKLVGTWEGTTKMGDKEEKTTVTYELTSNGTVITEKLGAGTPMEMVSIYHKDGKSLAMTHFCALGNHPQMNLLKADDKAISFEMKKSIGVSSMKEPHMHAMKITFDSDDAVTHEWTSFDNGKKKDTVIFNFKRKL
ncbi:MAG: hypothetical protein A4S09_03865 [Proteobacteria bacterium SG_bin7]|nr:MAG: hypothetical protein A4S09_03865 [Proteobacteria bacterium SG_bin7]